MGGKILVVDDEPDVQNLAKMILERAGYQIVTASNGVEGEEKAELEKPDLIILDVVMPGKNGFEVCQALKGRPETENIPIIIFSASGSRSRRDAALEAGADDFLQKPFTIKGLTDIVRKHLGSEGTSNLSSDTNGRS
jgi:DNA-binding response OmpR family regulator